MWEDVSFGDYVANDCGCREMIMIEWEEIVVMLVILYIFLDGMFVCTRR